MNKTTPSIVREEFSAWAATAPPPLPPQPWFKRVSIKNTTYEDPENSLLHLPAVPRYLSADLVSRVGLGIDCELNTWILEHQD
ncbi:hypothetical protein ABW21_db0203761 [Orbilia brochopaga]|nr:hypothetical protein ABW21_db0203761 [Drechslerella brochopaga]